MRRLLTVMALVLLALTSCDKLEDSGAIGQILPGRWAFSYRSTEPLDFELSYRYVEFGTDGTCAVVYSTGSLNGTYRASDAAISIVASDERGDERTFLWRVLTMSPSQIVTEYIHQQAADHTVTLTVTLERL